MPVCLFCLITVLRIQCATECSVHLVTRLAQSKIEFEAVRNVVHLSAPHRMARPLICMVTGTTRTPLS